MNKQINSDTDIITELRLCRALVTALDDELNFTGAIISKTVYVKLKAVTDFYKEQSVNEEYVTSTTNMRKV
tara:strand:+ start:3844 stop:4056 length:213 start_codon:yes stop_codon:yes gene_type:complete